MKPLVKQGKLLFYSVALKHICKNDDGDTDCTMCAEADAYGSYRPRNEDPDPFPALSNGGRDELEMTQHDRALLQAELHPYRRLCKLTREVFDDQEKRKTLVQMKRLAANAMDLFEPTQNPTLLASQMGKCNAPCANCLELAAYGHFRPKNAI